MMVSISIPSILTIILSNLGYPAFGYSPSQATNNVSPPPDHDVIIIGGSIVGLATAVALTSSSSSSSIATPSPPKVVVYERARHVTPIGALLSLFPNGITALKSIDTQVANEVERVSIPLVTSEIKNSVDGETLRCIESNTNASSASGNGTGSSGSNGTFLCWYQLQQILSNAIQPSFDDVVKLGMEFVSYTLDDSTGMITVTFHDRNNDNLECQSTTCRVLIGADGVQSTVRHQMMARNNNCEEEEDDVIQLLLNSYNRTIFHALIGTNTLLEEEEDAAMNIIPPKGTAVIYKSNEVGKIFKIWTASDSTLAITATVNSNDDDIEVRKWTNDEAKNRMAQTYADFAPEVRDLIDQIPSSSIYANAVCDTDFLDTWIDDDDTASVIILGDAAHSMTPSLGQGANVGLEDAAEIGHLLRKALAANDDDDTTTGSNIAQMIDQFVTLRQERVREIHDASRMQALNKNKQDTTLGAFRRRDPEFFQRLYGWKPISFSGFKPFDNGSSE